MSSAPPSRASPFPGFVGVHRIHLGAVTQVYRAVRAADGLPVVLKTFVDAHPGAAQLQALEREYQIHRSVDSERVIRAYDLVASGHRYLLVLEDIGGVAVDKFLAGGKPALRQAIAFAIDTLLGLDELHRQQITHRDINPSNLIIEPQTGRLKLTDLSLATRLSQEVGELRSLESPQGTLPYLSPEQTGRMNRPVDHRSDFYSLGVTLYQWLVGALPFEASDPLQWVHHHIAHSPKPPHERADIPWALSAITLKLMAKSADERYQSVAGVLHDLRAVQSEIVARGPWSDRLGSSFRAGSHDLHEQFRLPRRFYGRSRELARLTRAFDTACSGQRAVCVITGPGGIGKTSLVGELIRPLTQRRGFFLRGKFEQYSHQEVYGAVVAALRQWLAVVLAQDATGLARWRARIGAALGDRASLLLELLPELGRLVGPLSPSQPATGETARLRVQLALDRLLRVIARPEHPLILVLDDVQWADAASLELLEVMLLDPEPRAILLLLAFRDGPGHDVRLRLEHLRDRVEFDAIALGPLAVTDIEQWLAETIPSTLRQLEPLARWVHAKTEGNPFFVREFLKTLYAGGQLRFDRAQQSWDWDLSQIEQFAITDNVVELVLSKLQQLPEDARALLPQAACLGHRFELQTLALLCDSSSAALARALWPAVLAGLVQPVGDTGGWERAGGVPVPGLAEADAPTSMVAQFVHDRVQQAAYALIPEGERAQAHRRVGLTLAQRLPPAELERQLFQVATHLQLGEALLDEPERLRAAEIHAAAGEKAQASAAFSDALAHFRHALDLLPPDRWERAPELTRQASLGAIGCGYAAGEADTLMRLVDETLPHLPPGPARQQVYRMRIHALSTARKHANAVGIGSVALRELGFVLPPAPSKLKLGWEMLMAWFATRRLLARGELPPMTDPLALAQCELLNAILPSCYMSAPELAVIVMCRQITLMERAGIGPYRDVYYAFAAVLMAAVMGNVQGAIRFADLIARQPGTVQLPGRCAYNRSVLLDHWQRPGAELLERCLRLHRECVEVGDLLYASFALSTYGVYLLNWGTDLRRHRQALELYASFRERFLGSTTLDYVHFYEHELRCRTRVLLEVPAERAACLGPDWVEAPYASLRVHPSDTTSLTAALGGRAWLHMIFGHFAQALQILDETEAHADAALGFQGMLVSMYVHRPLAALAVWPSLSVIERRSRMRMVRQSLATLRRFSKQARAVGQELFVAEHHLVEAERLRVVGRVPEALSEFSRAIDAARRVHAYGTLCLAYERAAACCRADSQLDLEVHFVREAAFAYERWGASVKLAQLEQLYPDLLVTAGQEGGHAAPTRTLQMSDDHLDPISAVRTSQALSGELALAPLLDKLMSAVCENAGAQRGFLFLIEPAQAGAGPEPTLRLVAGHALTGPLPISSGGPETAPLSLARFVLRMGQPIALDDAHSADDPLLADPYLQLQRPRSVLVLPVERKEERLGVLYLEHGETPGVFTERHREFLKLLTGQLAISLTNAGLYADLQEARLAAERARRAAETASEAKSFFLAKMSHELRTPLNAILGYTDLVREELADAAVHLVDDELTKIQLAGRNLSQLIGNILDLTKIESGHLEVHPEPFSPARLFEELHASVASEFVASKNQLVMEAGMLPPLVVTDRQKLRQVLLNLLTNANKYTQGGTVTLRGEIEGEQIRFQVIDTGVGIHPEQHELVFRTFTQLDNSYTRKFDGAGLGLSICRELCAALGGTLTLASEPGHGSQFTVTLPCAWQGETLEMAASG
jgi:predicted ATPase/signal transduction histidine kinase